MNASSPRILYFLLEVVDENIVSNAVLTNLAHPLSRESRHFSKQGG